MPVITALRASEKKDLGFQGSLLYKVINPWSQNK